ncbi:DNA repair protein complementing XP-C cells [Conger conger]|uniref:DNA repair protein complementing XP-C cells n=1 Tax=Conger conger TaxID=82655 RepID=UPI002A59C277|nr:DNA repair protein complementing XP-C cells [Conger conger]XP_061113696.1 DNA repair protein complementing XP-C cells [Conger conger]
MAKQKRSADRVAKTNTKKLQQITKGNAAGVKRKANSENGDKADDDSADEEAVLRKYKPKSRRSKPVHQTGQHSSKYFQNQKQPVAASHDNGLPTPFLEGTETLMKVEKEEEEESDDDEWEDVEELTEPSCAQVEPVLPSQPVEIEIETPDHARKRQRKEKREAEFETYLRRMMNRFNKEVLVDTHKVHLLCLVANGTFRNRLCSEPDLLAIGFSVVPAHFTVVTPDQADVSFLSRLLTWFRATFTLTPDLPQDQGVSPCVILERRLETLSARNHEEMTHVFLVILRSLQLFCRLVLSLQPIPLKPVSTKNKAKTSGCTPERSPSQPKLSPGVKRPGASSEGGAGPGRKRQRRSTAEKEKENPGAGGRPKNSRRRSVASKVSYKEPSSEGERSSEEEEFHLSSGEESEDSGERAHTRRGRKGRGKGKGGAPQRQRSKKEASSEGEEEEEEEEEEEGEDVGMSRRRKGRGADEWLEVYLEQVGRWVCLDVLQTSMGQPQQCTRGATQPMSYVLAVDGDGCLKDLSSRYDPTWMTSSRKRRVEPEWWEETLCGFRSPASQREQREDQELQAKLLDKPLPTAISEFKNHPLYALKRHLLKYEAIYPSTAAILGYCRGEAVYSRDCVHTLHSRDTWLKEARTVRLGEEPYKMVRGFSNRARKARQGAEQKDKDDLALFGPWQTEEYQPPVAVDGKVPRNDFGNVYLFRPCMLPVGCVHMHLPCLHKVARKLGIDCASAVTGFDFHCGFSHPVTDGYIVCEEYQEVLQAAWENEQDILQKKEREKREKRALDHWTLLVKGLLIRERLQRRYGRHRPEQSVAKEGERGLSSGEEDTTAVALASSWPQNRQDDQESETKPTTKREKRGQQKHLFPFEKM